MEDSALNLLSREFDLWGVKFQHRTINNGHVEMVWRATPDKETRRYIIPKTAGDHRGWLNARSKIRQLFRADGLVLKDEITKPKPMLQKALSMPQPVERDVDQIKLLRGEIADLVDLMLDLANVVGDMKKQLTPPEPVIEVPVIKTMPVPTEKQTRRAIKAIDYVSYNWNSTEVLARDMGVSKEIAYRKLYHLTKGKDATVELQRGLWRKKRSFETIPVGVIAKNGKLNGHGKRH